MRYAILRYFPAKMLPLKLTVLITEPKLNFVGEKLFGMNVYWLKINFFLPKSPQFAH